MDMNKRICNLGCIADGSCSYTQWHAFILGKLHGQRYADGNQTSLVGLKIYIRQHVCHPMWSAPLIGVRTSFKACDMPATLLMLPAAEATVAHRFGLDLPNTSRCPFVRLDTVFCWTFCSRQCRARKDESASHMRTNFTSSHFKIAFAVSCPGQTDASAPSEYFQVVRD